MAMMDPDHKKFPVLLRHYSLVRKLGGGGQATVFECLRISDGLRFACKSMPIRSNGGSNLEDIKQEVEVLRKLDGHPGVVSLKEVIVDDSCWHLILELCDCSLHDKIEREGRLSEKKAALLIYSLARTVQDLHDMGVVHRDLKSRNVLVSAAQQVKLADFGLCAYFCPNSPDGLSGEVGTPKYFAPEVVTGSYSKEVDIWGLGVILYHALTGASAFGQLHTKEILRKLELGEDVASTCLKWDSLTVSEEAKDLILGMMCPDPQRRLTIEQILSHPWVLKHTGYDGQYYENSVRSPSPSNIIIETTNIYRKRIRLQRVDGQWHVKPRTSQENAENIDGQLKHIKLKIRIKGVKRPHQEDSCNKQSCLQRVDAGCHKKIKLRLQNGLWRVVSPCLEVS